MRPVRFYKIMTVANSRHVVKTQIHRNVNVTGIILIADHATYSLPGEGRGYEHTVLHLVSKEIPIILPPHLYNGNPYAGKDGLWYNKNDWDSNICICGIDCHRISNPSKTIHIQSSHRERIRHDSDHTLNFTGSRPLIRIPVSGAKYEIYG